ncbi:glycoside hydrolase family 104 protein [Burkholderia cenocepacia]|uniref:glycoside hydrolase family 24 protein n=1 Tax=Burkholderia cenocepacia TaxID=95486 RepID=UPI002AB0BDF3|nr:glycoside hydrolase family 104 protein [Burkholderia cenocepacia]
MDRAAFTAVVAAIAGGTIYYIWRVAQDVADLTGDDPSMVDAVGTAMDDISSAIDNMTTTIDNTTPADSNVQAFLTMIRTGEGTTGPNGYRTLFGGSLFNSFTDHPNIAVTRGSLTSTAAGAYQILYRTWLEAKAALGLTDFSPASQDAAAVWLIKRRGALADVQAGRFDAAIRKCNKEWASLPGSPYGQPTLTLASAHSVLLTAGGSPTDGVYA